jgi:hypothetical protein
MGINIQSTIPPLRRSLIEQLERRANPFFWSMLALYLVAGLLTIERVPAVWNDEVEFSDPAANLALGKGFSSTFAGQPGGQFWMGYLPLYSFLLSFWFRVFGISLLAARSFNLVQVAAAAGVIWWSCQRIGLFRRKFCQLLLVALVLGGYGTALNARSGRVDSFGILLLAMEFAIGWSPHGWMRIIGSAFIGFLVPLTGLPLVLFSFVAWATLWVFDHRTIRCSLPFALGMVIGGATLFLLYSHHGLWSAFVNGVGGNIAFHENRVGWANLFAGVRDPSLVAVTAFSCLLLLHLWMDGSLQFRSPICLGLALAILIPGGFVVRGNFPRYCSYMAYLPLTFCLCRQLDLVLGSSVQRLSLARLRLAAPLLGLACLGLPVILFFSILNWESRDYARLTRFLEAETGASDIVYLQPEAYYAVKLRVKSVFREKYYSGSGGDLITVIITYPEREVRDWKRVGGKWRQVAEYQAPDPPIRLMKEHNSFGRIYHLRVYRRVSE